VKTRFDEADTDHDGVIEREEAKHFDGPFVAGESGQALGFNFDYVFNSIDVDHGDSLSWDELSKVALNRA